MMLDKKGNLVDGKTTTFYATTNTPKPWIEIDLGESVDIGKIIVKNRIDCCEERINTCILSVSNISGYSKNSYSYTFTGGESTYTITPSNLVNNPNFSTITNIDIDTTNDISTFIINNVDNINFDTSTQYNIEIQRDTPQEHCKTISEQFYYDSLENLVLNKKIPVIEYMGKIKGNYPTGCFRNFDSSLKYLFILVW